MLHMVIDHNLGSNLESNPCFMAHHEIRFNVLIGLASMNWQCCVDRFLIRAQEAGVVFKQHSYTRGRRPRRCDCIIRAHR